MRRYLVAVAGALAYGIAASSLTAQGFGLYEHGSCVMARAGAGVAAPCDDASGIFINPAGLTDRRGWTFTAGATIISAFGDFTNDTTGVQSELGNDPITVPHVYIAYGFDDRWAAGVGLFVPYGLGTRWPLSFEGRFAGYDNDLRTVYVQPTLSVKPHPMVALGFGLDVAIGEVELNQRLDFFDQAVPGAPPGVIAGQLGIPRNTEFMDARLTASGATGIGAHVGVLFEPTEQISLGARYITRITLDYDGEAQFRQIETGLILPADNPLAPGMGPVPLDAIVLGLMAPGGPFANQPASTSITMPDQFVAGIAIKPTPELTLLVDWQWVHWTVLDTIALSFDNVATPTSLPQNYHNTNGIRLGVDWRATDRWSFRGGVLTHTEASPAETVTPLLPESDRNEFTLGVGVRFTRQFAGNFTYQFVAQNDRRGRMRNPLPGEDPIDLNAGVYEFAGHLFGISLTWKP